MIERKPECPPACHYRHVGGCVHAEPLGKAWCRECRRRQPIEDVHNESHYVGDREVGCQVTDMVCGHTSVGRPVDLGPSPGGDQPGELRAFSLGRL